MTSAQTFCEYPSGYLFFRESIWTRYLGLEPSPVTLALCFVCGILLLVLCVECTLSIEKNSRYHSFPLGLRTALAVPSGLLFLDAIFPPHVTGNRHIESAIMTIGLYGIFKVWEICIAPLIDGATLPKWIKPPRTRETIINGNGNVAQSKQKDHANSQENLTHRQTRWGYSLDLLSNLRGVSWLGDRHFDFLASRVVSEQAHSPSRWVFIRDRLFHFFLVCLFNDVCDSITKAQSWVKAQELLHPLPDGSVMTLSPHDAVFSHQITSQPLHRQVVFVFIVAATTQLAVESFYTLFAVFCVGLFNVSPKAFPYFFNSPISLKTDSVRSFWGARWHHIFRRVYNRAIDPWLHVLGIPKRSTARLFLKVAAVFTISGFLHCFIQARTLVYHFPPGIKVPLIDGGALWFFMSQPFALLFEHLVIRHLTRRLPPPLAYLTRRVWTWGWLFWSARWWTDTWVKMGIWLPDEQVVYFSPTRGIWRGEWIVKAQ